MIILAAFAKLSKHPLPTRDKFCVLFWKRQEFKEEKNSCFGDSAESTGPYRELRSSLPAFILARFWTH